MDTIKEIPLITKAQSQSLVRDVIWLRDLWTQRGEGWYTLGAAAYLDSPNQYVRKTILTAESLRTQFSWLYAEVMREVRDYYNVKVKLHEFAAPPGFHIFEDTGDQEASIHIDTPFEKIMWPDAISSPFSFTVALALPEKAGLNYGQDLEFYEYKVGSMYLHDGLTKHQIAKPVPSSLKSPRITLQGHGAIVESLDTALIYF
tara:strand:+ start:374 stop:979 length:606 start_codon:yes stop_codon:yes gene_type:complete